MNSIGVCRRAFTGLTVWAISLVLFTGEVYAAEQSPQDMIQSITTDVLEALRTDAGDSRRDPARLVDLMLQSVVPHLDTELMAAQVLGRYWRGASDAQRKQFTEEFKSLLTKTYAAVFRRYANQTVTVLATQAGGSSDRAVVPTTIKSAGEQDIRVDYRVRQTRGEWLVYDVVVDGISLLINYRSEYSNFLQRNSLDKLINRLQDKNAEFARKS
jgi:phospholipid transport system substrate-binding protein